MQSYVHKEMSPFHYRKGYYFTKKRYSKGNVTPVHTLNENEIAIAKLIGSYGAITRPQIEAALGKENLYKQLKNLCDQGICNSYEKITETGSPTSLIFYCINKNKQTQHLIKRDKFSYRQDKIHKETAEILRYLSLVQWHTYFLRDYKTGISANELTEQCSIIRCKGPKSYHFLTFRFCQEDTADKEDAYFYPQLEEYLKQYKRKHPLIKHIYAVIICDATAGELKTAKKINQISAIPLVYTTDLHTEKGSILDWLFLFETTESGEIVRKRISVPL